MISIGSMLCITFYYCVLNKEGLLSKFNKVLQENTSSRFFIIIWAKNSEEDSIWNIAQYGKNIFFWSIHFSIDIEIQRQSYAR